MKKTTAHGRKLQRIQAHVQPGRAIADHVSPVGRAVYKKDAIDSKVELADLMTGVSVRIYMTQEGERDHKLLGSLALMLVLGTEIAVKTALHAPQTRQIHAALRTVVQISIDGGCWPAAQAKVLHEAAQIATAFFLAHEALGGQALPYAYHLANAVRCGTARMSDVAGAEIYNIGAQQ